MERNTNSLAGWINELQLLANHPEKLPGWARDAMRTIHDGLVKHSATAAMPGNELPDGWRQGARFALEAVSKVSSICWLTDSMKEICIKQAADAVIAERDRQRAMLAGVSAPAAQTDDPAAGFEMWWAEHMPEATQAQAFMSWSALKAQPCS